MPADLIPIPPAMLTKLLIRKHFLPISERTFDRMVSAGKFPPADLPIGGKIRLWKRETVEQWISDQTASTAAGVVG